MIGSKFSQNHMLGSETESHSMVFEGTEGLKLNQDPKKVNVGERMNILFL